MNADHRVRDGLADVIGLSLDPRLPETDDGLALIYQMRAVRPSLRVVVLWSPECGDASAFEICADESLDICVDATTFSDALIASILAGASPTDSIQAATLAAETGS